MNTVAERFNKFKQEKKAYSLAEVNPTTSELVLRELCRYHQDDITIAMKFFEKFSDSTHLKALISRMAPYLTRDINFQKISVERMEKVMAIPEIEVKDNMKTRIVTYIPITPFNYSSILANHNAIRVIDHDEAKRSITYQFSKEKFTLDFSREEKFYGDVIGRFSYVADQQKDRVYVSKQWDIRFRNCARVLAYFCVPTSGQGVINLKLRNHTTPLMETECSHQYEFLKETVGSYMWEMNAKPVNYEYTTDDDLTLIYAWMYDICDGKFPDSNNDPLVVLHDTILFVIQELSKEQYFDQNTGSNYFTSAVGGSDESFSQYGKEIMSGQTGIDRVQRELEDKCGLAATWENSFDEYPSYYLDAAAPYSLPHVGKNRQGLFGALNVATSVMFEMGNVEKPFGQMYVEGADCADFVRGMDEYPMFKGIHKVIHGTGKVQAVQGAIPLFPEKGDKTIKYEQVKESMLPGEGMFVFIRERTVDKKLVGFDVDPTLDVVSVLCDLKKLATFDQNGRQTPSYFVGIMECTFFNLQKLEAICRTAHHSGLRTNYVPHFRCDNRTFYLVFDNYKYIGTDTGYADNLGIIARARYNHGVAAQHNLGVWMHTQIFGGEVIKYNARKNDLAAFVGTMLPSDSFKNDSKRGRRMGVDAQSEIVSAMQRAQVGMEFASPIIRPEMEVERQPVESRPRKRSFGGKDEEVQTMET